MEASEGWPKATTEPGLVPGPSKSETTTQSCHWLLLKITKQACLVVQWVKTLLGMLV